MVDTMGEQLEYLSQSLKRKYPSKNFQFYNYGIGGQNIEDGLGRFYSPFQYKSRNYPALPDLKPDILIIGSFAYNPLNPFDRNKHWLSLIQLVNQAKGVSPRVYLLAEIAPRIHNFGVDLGGRRIIKKKKELQAHHIIEQLQNAEAIAKHLHVT